MKQMKSCILLGVIMLTQAAHAQNEQRELMTAKDIHEESVSNITLTNRTGQTITASGLFIASFDVNDCSACYGGVVSGDNLGGAMASFVTMTPNQSVPVGQNFLYNMIYNGIYYIKNSVGSSPCQLPGCTWPGDTPDLKWCISINATSINSNYTFSNYVNGSNLPAKIPAYSSAGNSTPFDYQYDLIDPSTLGTGNACLGPIACDDKNLTCKVSNAQTEVIEAY